MLRALRRLQIFARLHNLLSWLGNVVLPPNQRDAGMKAFKHLRLIALVLATLCCTSYAFAEDADLAAAEAELDAAEAELDAAEADLDLAEAEADLAEADADLAEAEAELAEAEAAEDE